MGVATSWQAPADLATTQVDPAVTITRSVEPAGDVPAASLVTVTLTVVFAGALATDKCYDVTDLAPSGLAPIDRYQDWPAVDDEGDPIVATTIEPYAIEGQRVRFCATPATGTHTATLSYGLRVVTTGT